MNAVSRLGVIVEQGIKGPVRVETTAQLLRQGHPTVNGVVLNTGDRVLVKDQTDPIENGIFTVLGGGVDPWERAPDFNKADDIIAAILITSQETGNVYQIDVPPGTYWNPDATAINFTEFASATTWGTILGTLSAQTDLQAALDLKAPLANPTLTGVAVMSDTGSNGQMWLENLNAGADEKVWEFATSNLGRLTIRSVLDVGGGFAQAVLTANRTTTSIQDVEIFGTDFARLRSDTLITLSRGADVTWNGTIFDIDGSLTLGSPLGVAQGGTSIGAYNTGALLRSSGTTSMTTIERGTTPWGKLLQLVSGIPDWQFPSHVLFTERADHFQTPAAGFGELWARSSDGAVMWTNRSGVDFDLTAGGGGSGVAGADTQIQYNNAGAFGADANLTWDGTWLNVTNLAVNGTEIDVGSWVLDIDQVVTVANDNHVLTYDDVSGEVRLEANPSGDVTKVGTPVNTEIALWTGDGTLGRDPNFGHDGTTFFIPGAEIDVGSWVLDIDQVVTAANDDHVLTYDDASGEVRLEANPAGGAGTPTSFAADIRPTGTGSFTVPASSNELTYIKIGRLVHVQGTLSITANNSAVGNVLIDLPFQNASLTDNGHSVRVPCYTLGWSGGTAVPDGWSVRLEFFENDTVGEIRREGASAPTTIAPSWAAFGSITFNFSYIAAS